ncbi:hypothetical protein DNTS_021724 [Danionella cerebrum]|uniref:C-type lectin domain-containing protein n=1 Tax=Danionella cerebrum TaxID=2873325 RepID=A0A553NJ68_9TELE|nr:hypothetical protein DNTS_021724 [Danionella translucida]
MRTEPRLIDFLFAGLFSFISCGLHDYVLIHENRTWNLARTYCLQNHIDIATVQTTTDWIELKKARADDPSLAWIGLYDDVKGWRWSSNNETPLFMHWDQNQPNNMNGNQLCVLIQPSGFWDDKRCGLASIFICESKGMPVFVNSSRLFWPSAQTYCRQRYNDLFTVRTLAENMNLHQTMQINNFSNAWIGLYRASWRWPDPNLSVFSLPWASLQPDNLMDDEDCAAVDNTSQIGDELCNRELFFFCSTTITKLQVLRLEVKVTKGEAEEQIAGTVMAELQQKLGVKMTWREQLDGRVFRENEEDFLGE